MYMHVGHPFKGSMHAHTFKGLTHTRLRVQLDLRAQALNTHVFEGSVRSVHTRLFEGSMFNMPTPISRVQHTRMSRVQISSANGLHAVLSLLETFHVVVVCIHIVWPY